MEEVIIIFTAKSVDACLKVGGSQSWSLDRSHARRCKYAILCRNAYTDWGEGKESHGSAFMIGHICDVVPSTETDGRWLIQFDKYALINKPNYWEGWRNPIKYKQMSEVSALIDHAVFNLMPEVDSENILSAQYSTGLTIVEAKKALSITYGVSPESIKIIIEG